MNRIVGEEIRLWVLLTPIDEAFVLCSCDHGIAACRSDRACHLLCSSVSGSERLSVVVGSLRRRFGPRVGSSFIGIGPQWAATRRSGPSTSKIVMSSALQKRAALLTTTSSTGWGLVGPTDRPRNGASERVNYDGPIHRGAGDAH